MHTPIRVHRDLLALVLLLVLCVPARSSQAQLTPERLYNGVGQRVVITVQAPDEFMGELSIKLHDPRTLEVLASATAAKGRTDLTGLFPTIWSEKNERVVLAQLYLDSVATGAPMVLQPIVTPNIARRVDPNTMRPSEESTATVVFEDDRLSSLYAMGQAESLDREKVYSGLRVYAEQEAVFETSEGQIVFRLRPDAAPNTVFNFMHLIQGGFYTNIIFHRVVASLDDGRPFVIQVGDPSGTGSGGPGYMIDLEKSTLPHDFGVLSMARAADPNTNGSQVFVCLSRDGTSFLDGRYTAFAQAVEGADVIRKIASVPVDANDRPLDPPMILSAALRDAPPLAQRQPPLNAAGSAEPERDPTVPDR